jgi:predicted ATP-grasp superfamily ATP-dependent carboligase
VSGEQSVRAREKDFSLRTWRLTADCSLVSFFMHRPACLILDAEMQCALPVIEALRRRGFHVTAASHKRVNMGFFSRYPNRRALYPAPKNFRRAFVERIIELAREHRYDFILPTDDISSEILTEERERVEKHACLPIPTYETFMKARDKSKTIKIALENRLPCPQTFFPADENIEEIAHKVSYPALVKANVSSGARGILVVHKRGELKKTYEEVKAAYGECHVQEFIPKGGLQYKADLFIDDRQELKGGMVYSKLRYFPVNGGSSVVNRTVHYPQLIDIAYQLLKAMNWRGFADFDFITDPRDGIPKIMEINPRIPACFRITLAAGIDFASMIARLAMGQTIPKVEGYKRDVYLRYFPLDVLWFIKSPDRFRAEPSFFKFFGRNLSDQIISLRDPGPIVGFCLENFISLFDWEARKIRYSRGW